MSAKGEQDQQHSGSTRFEQPRDYYTVYPPLQPKRAIADYIDQSGIPIPHRFSGIDEAVSSGKPFMIRSEHPQDYAGISGLLESYTLDQEQLAELRSNRGVPQDIDWTAFIRRPKPTNRKDVQDQVLAQIGTVPQDEFEHNL